MTKGWAKTMFEGRDAEWFCTKLRVFLHFIDICKASLDMFFWSWESKRQGICKAICVVTAIELFAFGTYGKTGASQWEWMKSSCFRFTWPDDQHQPFVVVFNDFCTTTTKNSPLAVVMVTIWIHAKHTSTRVICTVSSSTGAALRWIKTFHHAMH